MEKLVWLIFCDMDISTYPVETYNYPITLRKGGGKMSRKILLINDMAGYGKVALSAMIPVLSHMKYEVFNLPTALVSNTLDYGKFDILETTDYMRNSMKVWEELGFEFDAISTGFIVSEEQAELVAEFCAGKSRTGGAFGGAKGATVFTDPIMGDDGKLYNGVTENTVKMMRKLISASDYIVPNYTEAAYLAEMPCRTEGASPEEISVMIDRLRALGAKSVAITSIAMKGMEKKSVAGYDFLKKEYFKLDFEEIPVRFPGTGDIFSSVLMGGILDGKDLRGATRAAMDTVKNMIAENMNNKDKYKGIPLELCLEALDR